MSILLALFEFLRYKKLGFDWKSFKVTATERPWTISYTCESPSRQLNAMWGIDVEAEIEDALIKELEEDMTQVIGICGLIGSGKDTVGQQLVDEFGFTKVSFAGTLKDMTAVLFDWDRNMLEGTTPATRLEREIIDEWWSDRLGRDWSPRIALQQMGTEVIRNHLHSDMWIHTVENKIRKLDKVVITDCRFANEIDFVKKHGDIWVVERGEQPNWWSVATHYNRTVGTPQETQCPADTHGVHASEYSWAGVDADYVIDNNSSIEDLYTKVRTLNFVDKVKSLA